MQLEKENNRLTVHQTMYTELVSPPNEQNKLCL